MSGQAPSGNGKRREEVVDKLLISRRGLMALTAPIALLSVIDMGNFTIIKQFTDLGKALEQTRYNKTAAAKLLGMSFRALRYRIKKLGIE